MPDSAARAPKPSGPEAPEDAPQLEAAPPERLTRLLAVALQAAVSLAHATQDDSVAVLSRAGPPLDAAEERGRGATVLRRGALEDGHGLGLRLTTEAGAVVGVLVASAPENRAWSAADRVALADGAALVHDALACQQALAQDAALQQAAGSIHARRLTAELAHELRTPLYAISMITEELIAEVAPKVGSELQRIDAMTGEALRVIDHQLELAGAEQTRDVLHVGELEVDALLRALRGMLEPLPRPAGVRLVVEDGQDLPPVRQDAFKLSEILRNLATNALRHTTAGEVRVAAALRGDRLAFTISDTGVGIALADQDRIFAPFEQLAAVGPAVRVRQTW